MHKSSIAIVTAMVCVFAMQGHAAEGGSDESPHIQRLRAALLAKHADFPLISVNTRQENVSFTTIDLTPTLTTVDGKNYYAFRFTVPEEGGTLVWSFKVPKAPINWYIIPVEGRMQGFSTFVRHRLPGNVPNLGEQGELFVLQVLPAQRIQPNADYIIWFSSEEDGALEVAVSLNVLRYGPQNRYANIFPMLYSESPHQGTRIER